MKPRSEAELHAYYCRRHPGEEAAEMWPWKKADRLCQPCIYDAQAGAESLSEIERARPYPALRVYEVERSTDGRIIGTEYEQEREDQEDEQQ